MNKSKRKLSAAIVFIFAFSFLESAYGQLAIADSLLHFKNTKHVVVGIKQSEPFIDLEEEDPDGLSIYLWEKVAEDLSLTYEYKEYETINDILDALKREEIGLSINPITVTPERLLNIEFSQPFFISNLAVVIRRDQGWSIGTIFRLVFSQTFIEILGFLAIVIMIFGFMAWIFERKHNKEQFAPGIKGLWDAFWWSAVTMTTVGYGDKAPKSFGGRMVALFWMFTAIIIIGIFTGSVASLLTYDKLSLSVNDFEDLKSSKVLTIEGSTSEEYLKSKGVTPLVAIDLNDALQDMIEGDYDALVYDETLLQHAIDEQGVGDELTLAPVKFLTQYYAFGVPLREDKIHYLNMAMINRMETLEWKSKVAEYGLD